MTASVLLRRPADPSTADPWTWADIRDSANRLDETAAERRESLRLLRAFFLAGDSTAIENLLFGAALDRIADQADAANRQEAADQANQQRRHRVACATHYGNYLGPEADLVPIAAD